ncbi:MAG TPA: RNA polymerase factor sigma-54 [bacterium]|nr:RNA polymerase factor sigma-54 [bacterium]HPS29250.1 RNA polymerase factor sigma-54 [bacterium]
MVQSIRLQQNLVQKQELKMTQQMRQSIEMLLKNTIELRDMLLAEVEENPFLEIEDWGDTPDETGNDNPDGDSKYSGDDGEEAVSTLKTGDNETHMSDILAEFDWNQLRENSSNSFGETTLRKKNDFTEDFNFENVIPAKQSFQQYLDMQICSTQYPDNIKEIMIYMAYDLNEKGFAPDSDEDIAAVTGSNPEDVATARNNLKKCDPAGCGCYDLVDYLKYMFAENDYLNLEDKHLKAINKLLSDEALLALLIKKDFNLLCEALELDKENLTEVLTFFRSGISPYPAFGFERMQTEYVKADMKVFLIDGEAIIQIEDKLLPTISLNTKVFEDEMKNATRDEKRFMKEKYRSAEWIIKSISERNRTLYQVASSIFAHQKAFLELGESFLKPLALKDISEDIERHPATVSRLTNGKFAETPHGIFELKYFFVKQINDNMTTNRRLEQRIREIIEKEDKENPFSDDDIAHMLGREGIDIARRTVAKYRSKLNIPLARERKKNYQFIVG